MGGGGGCSSKGLRGLHGTRMYSVTSDFTNYTMDKKPLVSIVWPDTLTTILDFTENTKRSITAFILLLLLMALPH